MADYVLMRGENPLPLHDAKSLYKEILNGNYLLTDEVVSAPSSGKQSRRRSLSEQDLFPIICTVGGPSKRFSYTEICRQLKLCIDDANADVAIRPGMCLREDQLRLHNYAIFCQYDVLLLSMVSLDIADLLKQKLSGQGLKVLAVSVGELYGRNTKSNRLNDLIGAARSVLIYHPNQHTKLDTQKYREWTKDIYALTVDNEKFSQGCVIGKFDSRSIRHPPGKKKILVHLRDLQDVEGISRLIKSLKEAPAHYSKAYFKLGEEDNSVARIKRDNEVLAPPTDWEKLGEMIVNEEYLPSDLLFAAKSNDGTPLENLGLFRIASKRRRLEQRAYSLNEIRQHLAKYLDNPTSLEGITPYDTIVGCSKRIYSYGVFVRYDYFVSTRKSNYRFARKLIEQMETRGLTGYLADADIGGQGKWQEKLDAGVLLSRCVLAIHRSEEVFNRDQLISKECDRERRFAIQRRKAVLNYAVNVAPLEVAKIVPGMTTANQIQSLSESLDPTELDNLVRDIRQKDCYVVTRVTLPRRIRDLGMQIQNYGVPLMGLVELLLLGGGLLLLLSMLAAMSQLANFLPNLRSNVDALANYNQLTNAQIEAQSKQINSQQASAILERERLLRERINRFTIEFRKNELLVAGRYQPNMNSTIPADVSKNSMKSRFLSIEEGDPVRALLDYKREFNGSSIEMQHAKLKGFLDDINDGFSVSFKATLPKVELAGRGELAISLAEAVLLIQHDLQGYCHKSKPDVRAQDWLIAYLTGSSVLLVHQITASSETTANIKYFEVKLGESYNEVLARRAEQSSPEFNNRRLIVIAGDLDEPLPSSAQTLELQDWKTRPRALTSKSAMMHDVIDVLRTINPDRVFVWLPELR